MDLFDKPSAAQTAAVDAAITSRHSMRAFLPTLVPRETVEDILRVAARAPSGTNTQPWQVHVFTGAAKKRLSDRISAVCENPPSLPHHRRRAGSRPVRGTDARLGPRTASSVCRPSEPVRGCRGHASL